jgi:thiol:disulfide interchange protein DsbD
MKQLITILSILTGIYSPSLAQSPNPVHWSFTSEKAGDNTWLVHCVATIDSGWHIYSQTQPKDAIAQPTMIRWTANPLILPTGKATEVGRLEHTKDEVVGIEANQYEKRVDFEQKVTLRHITKTKLTGRLTFQVCTNEMCLPPKTIPVEVFLP